VLGFVCTVLVAALDEFHQSFLPSRTGTFHDVVLDTCAALFAQIVIFLILRKRRSGIE
jgi:VanZ family protein